MVLFTFMMIFSNSFWVNSFKICLLINIAVKIIRPIDIKHPNKCDQTFIVSFEQTNKERRTNLAEWQFNK